MLCQLYKIIIMEQKPATTQADMQKVTFRRSRKDQEGRDFLCGCGKRYLSYPALYTHIKTKHEGKQPEGTLKTGANVSTKRAKVKIEEEVLRQIYALFQQFPLEILNKLDENFRGSIPVTSRIKKDGVPKEVYEQYLNITRQQEFKLTQHSSLDLALALFLLNIGQLLNQKVYDQFLIFVRLARSCFFEHGEQIHRAIYLKKDTGPFQMKDFNIQFVKYFPLVSDFFIRFYIPYSDNKDIKEANLAIMEIITYDFCNWLHKSGLTNIKIELLRDVEIDFKPSILFKTKQSSGKAQNPKDFYSKEIKEEENEDESQQLSENEEMDEEIYNEDKHPYGSKENDRAQ